MTPEDHPLDAWGQARLAAALLAVDPGLGGALVIARAGPARDAWLSAYRELLGEDVVWRRIPADVNDEALSGGIDLAATLKSGRAVRRGGLLEAIRGGVGVLSMAERAEAGLAARLAAALDGRTPPVIIALDESAEPDEGAPGALTERLALHVDLNGVSIADLEAGTDGPDIEQAAMARIHLPHVLNGGVERALTETAVALGIDTLRAPLQALRAARASAALAGRDEVDEADMRIAARLVLAPRATRLPAQESEPEAEPEQAEDNEGPDESETQTDQDPGQDTGQDPDEDDAPAPSDLTEITTEAAQAAIPPGLLARLQAGAGIGRARGAGKAGATRKDGQRGRPAGVRRGDPGQGKRLDVMATLRAAAPWGKARRRGLQRLRPGPALEVRREDFRVKHFKQKAETVTIFVVDASGSLALNRLAEAKGAVELMLAESYVRRDQVALVVFKGQTAQVVLPPTRSLTRAKKSLAALPGGGGTPLAAAIETAEQLADATARQGRTVTLVFLTDGAANVTREGAPGRDLAQSEAREAARRLRLAGHGVLLVDVSKRGAEDAQLMAEAMAARYVRLPRGGGAAALADLAKDAAA